MPSWTQPFGPISSIEQHRRRLYLWPVILVSFGSTALAFHVAKLLLIKALLLYDIFLLASWLLLLLTVGFNRPVSAPSSLLGFYVFEIVAELSRVIPWTNQPAFSVIFQILIAACSLMSIITILCMPIQLPSSTPGRINDRGSEHYAKETPEDNIRLFRYFAVSWVWPLLVVGKQRQLQKEDIWTIQSEIRTSRLAAVFASLQQSTVFRKLLHANAIDCCILSVIACIQLILEFSSPILLHQFLYVIEKPSLGKQPPVLYSLLLLARGVFFSQFSMLGCWYGRRCFERTRGLLSMTVYQKTLLRKNIASMKTQNTEGVANGSSSIRENGANGNGTVQNSESGSAAINSKSNPHAKAPAKTHENEQGKLALFKELLWGTGESIAKSTGPASKGQVLNIVRSDVMEIAGYFQNLSTLIKLPIGLFIAVWLIWDLLGPSCLLGVLVLFISQLLTIIISRLQMRWRRYEKKAKDERIQITSTYIEVIRHLRWYAWQDAWLQKVFAIRRHELNVRAVRFCLSFSIYTITTCAGALFPAISFIAYTAVGKQQLRIDLIFPALQLFASLQSRLRQLPGLVTSTMNVLVAMERLEEFEQEPNLKTSADSFPPPNQPSVALTSCTFAWPGQLSPAIKDATLSLPSGLTLVYGEIGSGKTGKT
jgi:ABC-type multidrug transport system fused ATPase/permease subunit